MLPASVNFWETLETLYYIDLLGWEGGRPTTSSPDRRQRRSRGSNISDHGRHAEADPEDRLGRVTRLRDDGTPARVFAGLIRSLVLAMEIGIGSYAWRWAIGIGDAVPAQPLTPVDLVRRTRAHGLSLLQIADNLPLHLLPQSRRRRARARGAAGGCTARARSRQHERRVSYDLYRSRRTPERAGCADRT